MFRCAHRRKRARLFSSYIAVFTVCVIVLILSCFHCNPVHGADEGYTIQLGAYQDAEAAQEKVNELKRLGYNAFHKEEPSQGKGVWYRIYVERFVSKEAAEKEASILKELGLIADYIVRRIPSERAGEQDTEQKDRAAYYLRVGAFKNEKNAEKLVRAVQKEGQNAMKVSEKVSGDRWFRVYVGGYGDESEANKVGSRLKEKGLISGFRTLLMEEGRPPSAR